GGGRGPEAGRLELLRQAPCPHAVGCIVVDGGGLERLPDLADHGLGRLASELVACGVDEPVERVAQALDCIAGIGAAAELSLARRVGGVEELVEIRVPSPRELVHGPGGGRRLDERLYLVGLGLQAAVAELLRGCVASGR